MSANLFDTSWKNVTDVNVYVDGNWKTAQEGWIWIDGTWKQWWPSVFYYNVEYNTCPCSGLPASMEIQTDKQLTINKYYYAGSYVVLKIVSAGGTALDGTYNGLFGPFDTCVAACPATTTTTTTQISTTTTTTTTFAAPNYYDVIRYNCPSCSTSTTFHYWTYNTYTPGLYYRDLYNTYTYYISSTGESGIDGEFPITYGGYSDCAGGCNSGILTTTTTSTLPPDLPQDS